MKMNYSYYMEDIWRFSEQRTHDDLPFDSAIAYYLQGSNYDNTNPRLSSTNEKKQLFEGTQGKSL